MADTVSKKKLQTKRKQLFFVFLVLTALWTTVIFVFSGQDGETSSSKSRAITQRVVQVVDHDYKMPEKVEPKSIDAHYDKIIRKTAHACIYAILGFLAYATVYTAFYTSKNKRLMHMLTIILCVIVAISDEINQHFTEGRDGRLWDVLIDLAGIVLGTLFCRFISSHIAKRKNK